MTGTRIEKADLIARIVAELERELAALVRAAEAAREAATHEESKAEDKYDTRGLEASYLAGAQAARAGDLQRLIVMYRHLSPRDLPPDAPVEPGAVVELDQEGRAAWVFVVAQGGGLTVDVAGKRVQVITPAAPLGEALLGKRAGDAVEVEAKGGTREYGIVSVR